MTSPRIKAILERMDEQAAKAAARKATPWVDRSTRSSGCDLSRYEGVLEASTSKARNLSPSLRGCYADPIEWAMEEHSEKLPVRLGDPGAFESTHYYDNPKDPTAWPKVIKIITLCRNGRARSFAMKPNEDLSVFPKSEVMP